MFPRRVELSHCTLPRRVALVKIVLTYRDSPLIGELQSCPRHYMAGHMNLHGGIR